VPSLVGRHAVVIGAGIAGLAAARGLSSLFTQVSVLERDDLPTTPAARAGTPQAQQVHVLLRGGLDALRQVVPTLESDLECAGAVRVRVGSESRLEVPEVGHFPMRDLGFDFFSMTRPLLEWVLRERVRQVRNVEIKPRCRATRLLTSWASRAVTGVCFEAEDGHNRELAADFVIDASSRGALSLAALGEIGAPKPEETEIGVDLRYATAMFEIPPSPPDAWRAVLHRPSVQTGRGGLLVPVEGGRWQVNLTAMHGGQVPETVEDFIAFAKTLRTPTIHDAIVRAAPLGPVRRFGFPSSVRRRFEDLDTFPRGLLPLGDAVCRFNPAFGQGMSVAAQELAILLKLIADREPTGDPLKGLAGSYFTAIQDVLAAPWSVAEGDFAYDKTLGRRPSDLAQRLRFNRALQQLAAEDGAVHRLMSEVSHLVRSPAALRDPHIVSRVTAIMDSI